MPFQNSFHTNSFQVKGRKNSGKTTLLEFLTAELTARGFLVGTYKTSPHGHPIDRENTDSDRLRKSGAFPSAFQSPDGLAIFYNGPNLDGDMLHKRLVDAYKNCDLVLVESYTGQYGPVIALSDSMEVSDDDEILCVVNRTGTHPKFRACTPGDQKIADEIQAHCR